MLFPDDRKELWVLGKPFNLSPTWASSGLRHFFNSLTTCSYTAEIWKFKENTSKVPLKSWKYVENNKYSSWDLVWTQVIRCKYMFTFLWSVPKHSLLSERKFSNPWWKNLVQIMCIGFKTRHNIAAGSFIQRRFNCHIDLELQSC